MNVRQQIAQFEGKRYVAYPDPLTGGEPWTIGVGHCGPEVTRETIWDDDQVEAAFSADLERVTQECKDSFPFFERLNEPRQAVLLGMCFQMGLRGLQGFPKMLARIEEERWSDAANEMRTSLWAKQTPNRARRLAAQLETGEWN